MFCPKCGTKNPDDGKFCRKCGTELEDVAMVLKGGNPASVSKRAGKQKSSDSWEGAVGKIATGLAFLTIAIILGVTGAVGGHVWWFWMLIPAFAMMGAGAAQIFQLRSAARPVVATSDHTKELKAEDQPSLQPSQTEYVAPDSNPQYETGDLVPPSVVEETTRHLKVDKEGQTMTLPKKK